MASMVKKMSSKAKDFDDNANYQGSKKVPMKQVKEYGTGLPYKAPKPRLATRKK